VITEQNGKWSTFAISRDHKPELPEEHARINKHGGRVEAYKDEFGHDFGPKRVWLKYENLPGLAMSRSFGDLCASRAGVIQIPEVKEYQLTKNDRAIFLASDGVWEFLEDDDVMNILIPFLKNKQEELGVNEVVKKSVAHWKKEDVVIDDITGVLAVFARDDDNHSKTIEHNTSPQKKEFRIRSQYSSVPNFHS